MPDYFQRKAKDFKINFAVAVAILAVLLVCSFFRCEASADDAALYALINGKTFTLTVNQTAYRMVFNGNDAENMSGAAWLYWPETIPIDGYRYVIHKKLLMPFMILENVVDVDVSEADGSISTYSFTLDYEGALIQVCPDLRFFPEVNP